MKDNQEHIPLKLLQNGKVEYTPMSPPSYGTTVCSPAQDFCFGFRNNYVFSLWGYQAHDQPSAVLED